MTDVRLFARNETEEFRAVFTPWSVPHFLVGMAAKERGVPFWWFQLLHGAYEAKDFYRNKFHDEKNSTVNSLGDHAVATVGHCIASKNTNSWTWTVLYAASWAGATFLGDSIG